MGKKKQQAIRKQAIASWLDSPASRLIDHQLNLDFPALDKLSALLGTFKYYTSGNDFYNDNPERVLAREISYGSYWAATSQNQRKSPPAEFHATFIVTTGEMYLSFLADKTVHRIIITNIKPRSIQALEKALYSWQEKCAQPGSISWLFDKLAPLALEYSLEQQRPIHKLKAKNYAPIKRNSSWPRPQGMTRLDSGNKI